MYMPLDDAGALIFFEIQSCTSNRSRETTERMVTKEEQTVHTQTYAYGPVWSTLPQATNTIVTGTTSRPIAWEDTHTYTSQYYDSNGYCCGTSKSSGNDSGWSTDYYDSNGHYLGSSKGDNHIRKYYHSNGKFRGTSKGNTQESTYYEPDGSYYGTAISDGRETTYFSPQQMAEREEQERAGRNKPNEAYERDLAELLGQYPEYAPYPNYCRSQITSARDRKEREQREREALARANSPIPFGSVKKQVVLLSNRSLEVRSAAQNSLLRMSHRPGFLDQIKYEALPIINAMVKVITNMTTSSRSSPQIQKEELWNSLTLFGKLPFQDEKIQTIIIQSKIIPFLIKMRDLYIKRASNSVLGTNITEEFRKMAAIDNVYKDAIAKAQISNEKISRMETYYVSQAGFFNASNKIFKNEDYDSIVSTIRARASKNPEGASEKTLRQFSLK